MRTLLVVAAIATIPACAYDRDIGPVPYLCGPTEPRCPDEYTCTADDRTGRDVCIGPGGNPNGFDCVDDTANEPNDQIGSATPTPTSASMIFMTDGAICPAGDIDIFKITITVANQKLEVMAESDAGGPILTASILNGGGAKLVSGTPATGMPNTSRAAFAALPIGDFYAQVAAPSGGALGLNNYHLTLRVSGP